MLQAGRLLALLELRIFLVQFALNFNIQTAKDFDPDQFQRSIKDRFTVQKGQ